jgi:hypothetical protein
MGVYQCEVCGCIENTATGRYHTRKWDSIWGKGDPKTTNLGISFYALKRH